MGEPPIALVTGGAIRVGRSIVQALAASGYRVWIHYRSSATPAKELAAELGPAALGPLSADLAAPTERHNLVERVTDASGPAGGRLNLLVNSAASFERGSFLHRTDDELRRVLETNLVAPVSLARGLSAALLRSVGSIVNIVDIGAFEAWPGYLDHCVAKAGLAMATRALAVELAPIRANAVAPGTVIWPDDAAYAEGGSARERILDRIPLGRIGGPQDVAEAVMFFAGSEYVTGQVLAVDGGRLAAGSGRGEGSAGADGASQA